VSFRNTAFLLSITLCLLTLTNTAHAQEPDSLLQGIDSTITLTPDSTTIEDSLVFVTPDSLPNTAPKDKLDAPVQYDARDSIRISTRDKTIYLYGNAHVYYQDIELNAGYIELNYGTNILTALPALDSLGNAVELPVFKEGDSRYESQKMVYNFVSKKGNIYQVTTREGDGFLHGEKVKKVSDKVLYIKNGYFTTDDRTPPAYYIKADRIKIITNEQIITGPAYMVIADVPTPLVAPFGIFPASQTRSSGFIIPTYGENRSRGFFLRNGGYYFALNDYMDFQLTGDIYSRGGWGLYGSSNYKLRYKFSGNFLISYSVVKAGERDLPGYTQSNDFNIKWNHNQDAKAHPSSRFSANVNAGSSTYFQYNTTNPNDYLRNQMNSAISWSYSNAEKPWSLSANLRHSQNTATRAISITLPDVAFNVQRFMPFERKVKVGKAKWYENIGAQYSMNFKNQIDSYDTLLFKDFSTDQLKYGFRHNIPISTNINLFKFVTATPQFTYNERWYFDRRIQSWDPTQQVIVYDTVNGFGAVRDFSFNTRFTTKIYGMWNYRRGKITALRHVLTPSVNVIFQPDFSEPGWGYYDEVQIDTTGRTRRYSFYDQGIYGTAPQGKQGSINLSLINNLDLKYRSFKDSVETIEKLSIFESFTFNTGYNLVADSFNLAPLTFNGRTKFFNGAMILRVDGTFDFYALDNEGIRVNQYQWERGEGLSRFTQGTVALTFNLKSKQENKPARRNDATSPMAPQTEEGEDEDAVQQSNHLNNRFDTYVDFSVPWNLSADYNITYRKPNLETLIVQSLAFRGDFSLTPNWKMGFTSGLDMETWDLTYTTIDIYRDLYSWEMRLSWVPFGFQQSYNFYIGIKAPVLKDVRVTHRRGLGDF
jgi:lipopolysaccharide assembly outer membrane protein LptD (OstA)